MSRVDIYAIKIVVMAIFLLHVESASAQRAPAQAPPDGLPRTHTCRVLIIDSEDGEPYDSFRVAFMEELSRLGCNGEGMPSFQRYSLGNEVGPAQRIRQVERFAEYDAVVLQGTIAAIAFYESYYSNMSQPFFFASVTDPVGLGLIEAFDQPPSANFTGIAYPVPPVERLRFVRQLLPDARRIGVIHTDMPQSIAYNALLLEALAENEFQDLKLIFREVPFVSGEHGMRRSIALARAHVHELDDQVDVFLSPNDQMGIRDEFVMMLASHARTPLIGIGEFEVHNGLGAVASLFSSTTASGRILATMVHQHMSGTEFSSLYPREAEYAAAFNPTLTHRFGIQIPEGHNEP